MSRTSKPSITAAKMRTADPDLQDRIRARLKRRGEAQSFLQIGYLWYGEEEQGDIFRSCGIDHDRPSRMDW